jgi:plastocyanin
LAAEYRASQASTTTVAAAEPADSDDTDERAATEPPTPMVPPVEPTGVVVPVIALDNSFRPEVIEISVGDEVLWENRGLNEHNALFVVGDDWGVEVEQFQPGDVYALVFTEPGEYDYFCSIHGSETVGMIGTVIVSE